MPDRVLATSDCERCRPGIVSQPANTVSSLAYVVAGAAMLRTRPSGPSGPTEQAVGWATVAVGLGSVAYHGPGGALSRYAHDAGLIAMLGFVAWADVEVLTGERKPVGLAAVPLVAAVGAVPRLSPTTQALAGLAAIVAESAVLRRGRPPFGRTWRSVVAVPVGAVALAAQVFGRSGGPWCRPDSLLQPHALWHVLTAASLWHRSTAGR